MDRKSCLPQHRAHDRNSAMPERPLSEIISSQTLVSAAPDATVCKAAQLMKTHHVGSVLIVDQDRLTGIFTERDAVLRMLAAGLDPASTPLEAVMTRAPQTLTPRRPFGHALHLMYEGGFRHVPVLDSGKLLGIVSARDALGSDLARFAS